MYIYKTNENMYVSLATMPITGYVRIHYNNNQKGERMKPQIERRSHNEHRYDERKGKELRELRRMADELAGEL